MTPSTSLDSLLTRAALLVLSTLGVTDGALPDLARAGIPPAVALVLAVIAYCEHRTRQVDTQATVAAAKVAADARAAAAPPPAPPAALGGSLAQVIAETGALVESARAGVLATAAPAAVPAPAPAPEDAHTYPLDVYGRHEAPADDYPTQTIGLVPAVPVR